MNKYRVKKRLGVQLQIVLVGALTGLFAGVVVTLYNMLAGIAEDFSRGYYALFRAHPALIPLLFCALFLGAIVVGGMVRFTPIIRGSGIPQTEGALRGLMRFRWYRALTGMFVTSLLTIFMGMSAGAEGPSLMIGGACGYGASDVLKRGALLRRYQITGGACAGLAVAFNAPLTGMVFAFEEGQKRFTTEVFLCAISSVVCAVLTRNLLGTVLDLETGAYFHTYAFHEADMLQPMFYAYVLAAAAVTALVGVGFYFLVFLSKKVFAKITFWKGAGRMLPPFLLAGGAGLLTAYAMGGGHEFLLALGSGSEGVERIFSEPLWVTLCIVVVLKLVLTVVNMGAGVPCGAFIPMLAIGAGVGALMRGACVAMGMNEVYSDALILICMATFFTAVVRAPLTGVIMTVELSWNFFFLLPAVIGVAVGYLVGGLFRIQPLYDRLLDEMLADGAGVSRTRPFTAHYVLAEESLAVGRALRDILLPPDVRVVRLQRGEEGFMPNGNTQLLAGDLLTVEGEERGEVCATLKELFGTDGTWEEELSP